MKKVSVLQLLTLAEKIEQQGKDLYLSLSLKTEEPKLKSLFDQLAEWEQVHKDFFSKLKKEATESTSNQFTFNPEDYTGLSPFDLQKMAEDVLPKEEIGLNSLKDRKDIINYAVKLEEKTIKFYAGLKKSVRMSKSGNELEKIMKEEKKHIRILKQANA